MQPAELRTKEVWVKGKSDTLYGSGAMHWCPQYFYFPRAGEGPKDQLG